MATDSRIVYTGRPAADTHTSGAVHRSTWKCGPHRYDCAYMACVYSRLAERHERKAPESK